MSESTDMDTVDVVTFSLKLEGSAETFWELLRTSTEFNIKLSSIEVICSISKFILENDDLCRACVTKYQIYSNVIRVSKKAFKSHKRRRNNVTNIGSSKPSSAKVQSNVHTNTVVKVENEEESFPPVVRSENDASEDELNMKDNSIGTSELVRQALLEASDIQDFTYYDKKNPSLGKVHQKRTNREKRYACSICRKTFLRPYLIRKHLESAHNKKEWHQNGEQFIMVKGNALKELFSHVCPLCGKKFKEKRYLHNHYKFHIGQKRFACKICNRGFLWLCHTKKHVKDVHNKDAAITNVDQCVRKLAPLDSSLGSSLPDLNEECLKIKQQTLFSCNHCGKRFNQKRILNMHLLQKHSFGAETPNWQNTQVQLKEGHNNEKGFGENQTLNKEINLSSVSIANFVSNTVNHSSDASVLPSAEMFGDGLDDSSLDYQAKDEAKASFRCSYCEKCFTEKALVELHIFLTHEQDRLDTLTDENGQYMCPICEKKIGAKRNFKAHLHIHVKERYFMCALCNKSFLWHSCATRHVKTHGVVDVNQYMKMVTSDNLSIDRDVGLGLETDEGGKRQRDESLDVFDNINKFHNKAHDLGDNDHGPSSVKDTEAVRGEHGVHEKTGCTVCSHCCRGFMTHEAWKEHMKTCSVQNQYKCLLCSVSFPTKCSAHRHLRRVHNKESDEIDQLVGEETLHKDSAAPGSDPENLVHSESHFMCSVCKKFFRERRYLRQHMWTHRRQWMHRCKHCARYFTKKQFLQEHVINRHPQGVMKTAKVGIKNEQFAVPNQDPSDSHLCAVCGDPDADITPEGHMCHSCKDRAGGGIFTCGVCGIKMKNRHDLVVHSRTHEVREHKCDVCGKIYKQKKLLDIHKKEHSGEKPFCCEACGLRFASSERLRFHNYNVHSERLRRNAIKFYASSLCPICDIRVRIKDQMWNHLLIHSGNFELNCNYCDKFFTFTEALSAHGQSLHTNTEMPFSCYLCETSFTEKARLLEHFRIHPEKEVHLCTQCSNTFYLKADLREHIKSKHERKKRNTVQEQALAGVYRGPFPCKMCGRVYQKKASLDIHMKIHYGIFDFPCDFCEKKFKSAAECRIHRRQHTKEKPYQCPYCGEKFNRHSTLTQHKRRHTDERPYLCDDCGMAFRTRKTLQNHKLTHTKIAGSPQKSIIRAPPIPLPSLHDRNITMPHHTDLPQHMPVMQQPDFNQYYPYWNIPRT